MIELALVGLVTLAALAALVLLAERNATRVRDLLDTQALEREAWASERRELLTRIQAPQLAERGVTAYDPPPAPDPDDVDESWKVGMAGVRQDG